MKNNKYYYPNLLFIGKIGTIRKLNEKGKRYYHFDDLGFSIFIDVKYTDNKYYYEIFSNTKCINFHNEDISAGDTAVNEQILLNLFAQKLYKEIKDSKALETIVSKIINNQKISEKELKQFLYYLNNNEELINDFQNNTSILANILDKKNFVNEPIYEQIEELDKLLITLNQDKKNPILVGPTGVGKTALINEVAYKIQKNKCPDSIKGKHIIDITRLINGLTFEIKESFLKLIATILKKQHIIVIENIDSFDNDKTNWILNIIDEAIENKNLKVIATTNKKITDEHFNNSLYKKFKTIYINEPNDKILYEIINKTINDYIKNNNISTLDNIDNIIKLLIKFTNVENRIWNNGSCISYVEESNNPNLVIEIIDEIFAHAKFNNQNKLTIDNIIYGINSCDKINDNTKQEIIDNLQQENNKILTKKKFQ